VLLLLLLLLLLLCVCLLQVFRKRKERLPVDEHDLVSSSSLGSDLASVS
jgi:hypothetical protein